MPAREDLGPYRIVRRIAAGGMAEIYLARQRGIEGLERTVVIKQILEKHESNEEFITMFLDEARLMAALSHPNIAQVLDLGKTAETHYLVMEYVRGPTLGAILHAAQRTGLKGLPEKPALGIALAVAEALDYVHHRRDELGRPLGIVHRDLNPANVVVSWDGAVKLIDFGIAKAATRVYETRTGVVKGTYGYIAPEGLRGSPVDLRADVFAIGILLYEMLVGAHPYDHSDEPNLVDRIVEARYKRPREVKREISPALDKLIARCLTPHPEGRPATMRELIEGLTTDMAARGIVPTQGDLAALARELVPDEEGPQPLRRPSMRSSSRPLVAPRDGGTRPITTPVRNPPIESDPREEETRRLPRDSAPPAPPQQHDEDEDDEHLTVPAAPRPVLTPPGDIAAHGSIAAQGSIAAPGDIAAHGNIAAPGDIAAHGNTTAHGTPAAPRHIAPPRDIAPPAAAHPLLQHNGPPTPTPIVLDTTMRVRKPPKPLRLPPALGIAAIVAAGVLAFVVARALGSAAASPTTSLPPAVSPVVPPADAPRALSIVSEPPGAEVRVNGEATGLRTPAVVAVDAQVERVYLELSLAGHVQEAREVAASAGTARFVLRELDAGE